ncbi:MAG TPA: hypothetical protein VFR15_18875 [Chloroflexia bacterium]|nr:hypothetical protein [Chloroflexia bacterium]
MEGNVGRGLPLHIARALQAVDGACSSSDAGDGGAACLDASLGLADALTYYVGAVAVAQYSQAVYTERIEPDPTLNRSLRSLRRVLPGQWLGWAARGLEAWPGGPVAGMAEWYLTPVGGDIAGAYEALRRLMAEHLNYAGDYGPRDEVSPRLLLEMVDQYGIRRAKTPAESLPADFDAQVADTILPGLRAAIESAGFMSEYPLYAPQQRQLLMGTSPTTPMPPMSAPDEAEATILAYPPGEPPDYTKRPDLTAERLPLFPLDPLLAYLRCEQCGTYRVAALSEVAGGVPTYLGLDPDCGHLLNPAAEPALS